MHKRFLHGFTIVELLIVTTVIAILTTITIVTYNGTQQRARNTQIVAAARIYVDALSLYSFEKDSYPTFGAYAVCLGVGYPADNCWNGPNGDYVVTSSFDNDMASYVPSKPNVTAVYHKITAQDNRSGVVYYRNNPTGRQSIEYLLEGANKECVLSGAVASNVASNTATRCFLTLPAA